MSTIKVNRIEAQDIANSGWDYTNTSSYITCSFWLRASVTQSYYLFIRTEDGTQRLIIKELAVTANTWKKFELTIPGDSDITLDNNSDVGLLLRFLPWYGDNYTGSGTLDTWTSNTNDKVPDMTSTWVTTLNSTFDLTGLQLEVGSKATPFEHRSYGQTLAECERYFQRIHRPRLRGVANSSSALNRLGCTLPTVMRADPTINSNGTFSWYDGNNTGTITSFNSTYSDPRSFEVEGTAASGSSGINQPIVVYITSTSPAPYIDCSAEL